MSRFYKLGVVIAGSLLFAQNVARADVQLAEDDEVERPDAAGLIGDSPPGAMIDRGTHRPELGKNAERACSFTRPICVHYASDLQSANALAAIGSAERSWDAYSQVMGLPEPDTSVDTGAFDLYLVDHVIGEGAAILDARDVRTRVDRANAYALIDAELTPGCAQDSAIAYAIARAIQMRIAPAVDEGSARAEAESLATLVVPCAMGRNAGNAAAFQARPDIGFADTLAGADLATQIGFDRGASLFYSWLDETYGQYPGAIVGALWSLAPTITPLDADRWNDEPDGFDVLRKTFKNALSNGSTVDDLWLDFAVARAFFGSRADGNHGRESVTLGDGGAVPYDWEIDFPTSARTLALRHSIAPLGSAYVSIRLATMKPGARLRVEANWEEHAKMKLAIVRIDAKGKELGRLSITAPTLATNAQLSVVDFRNADRLLVVIVNAGDTTYPFDPDDAEWEPHALTLSVAPE